MTTETKPEPTPTLAQARAWLTAHGWTLLEEDPPGATNAAWEVWQKWNEDASIPTRVGSRGWLEAMRVSAQNIATTERRFCRCGAEILAEMAAMEETP